MNLNPYDPSKLTSDVESRWSKRFAAAMRPMPVRHVASTKPRWLQAVLHACAIVVAAMVVAPILAPLLGFLGPVAVPTSIIMGCFPIYIWMFYCRVGSVGPESVVYPVGLGFCLLLSFAAVDGLAALPNVLFSLAILVPVLATEWMIGKMLLWDPTDTPGTADDLNAKEP